MGSALVHASETAERASHESKQVTESLESFHCRRAKFDGQLRLSLYTTGWSIVGQRLTGYKSRKSELLDIERYRSFHLGEMEELLDLSHMVNLQVATSFTNRIGTTDISCLNRLSLPH